MLTESGIWMFVNCASVKIGKSVSIFCKVCGDPVKDHTNAVLVEKIYKIHKILG